LTRGGSKGRPYYRIAAMDSRWKRDGKSLEILGQYHPLEADEQKRLVVKLDRVDHWLSKGALPTEQVASLVKQARKRK
jgi:small subunit ribosomal protein S16